VELVGLLPLLLLAGLAALQLLLVGFTVTAAENAARSGSRAVALGGDPRDVAIGSLPDHLARSAGVDARGELVRVTVEVPVLVPGLSTSHLTVSRSAELPAR
jgi:hypothetical protein